MLALRLSIPALAAGALPPGYEDEAWCPPDHCIRATPRPEGFAGPHSMFWECAHIETGEAAAAFWTGARVNAVPRPGWVKVKSFLDESFQTIDCGTSTAAVLSASSTEAAGAAGAVGALGPAWTRGEIEAPQGEKSMGSWTAAVYTAEQQARLGVDEEGQPTAPPLSSSEAAAPPPPAADSAPTAAVTAQEGPAQEGSDDEIVE